MMTTQTASLLGDLVPARSFARPERVVLTGTRVRIEPLDARIHEADLCDALGGPRGAALWTYLPDGPFLDRADFYDNIVYKAASSDPLYFALIDRATGRASGHAALMRIDAESGVVEIGHIVFGERLRRQAAATEAMALLARYVFEILGYRRYEWKCDDLNAASKSAALRLGFTFEGVFRRHKIVKSRNRDTAWFSMIESEWPQCKDDFEIWLSPENFDANDRQKQSLAAVRARRACSER